MGDNNWLFPPPLPPAPELRKRGDGPRLGEADEFFNRGEELLCKGGSPKEAADALPLFEQALEIYQGGVEPFDEGWTLFNLSWAHQVIGNLDTALACSETSVEAFERAGEGNECARAKAIHQLGQVRAAKGEWHAAVSCYEEALEYWLTERHRGGTFGDLNLDFGTAYLALGDTLQALDWFRKAEAFFRELEYARGQVDALGRLTEAYLQLGMSERAAECDKQARQLHTRRTDTNAAP